MSVKKISDYAEITITPTTDMSLRAYSHSMLNSIATCPTYGIVTYIHNKVLSKGGRAMALEAGSASHETFAAARLWQVLHHQGRVKHADFHGVRLFGEARYESMQMSIEGIDDRHNAMLRFCLDAFYTSGFYDDPGDKRRTYTNIEEALIAYLNRFDFRNDVWLADADDPTKMIGIEIPIDVTLSFINHDGEPEYQLRFIGTADGLHTKRGTDMLYLDENKTASRLNDAWTMSFDTSHQVTGYMLGLATMLGVPIERAKINGMCIPLPRSYDAGGLVSQVVQRNDTQYSDLLAWVLHLVQIIDTFTDTPTDAPKNTGACNKYFRPCALIPLCASGREDRIDMFDNMVEREPSPTEKAMMDGED